jgi:hypothetical protein
MNVQTFVDGALYKKALAALRKRAKFKLYPEYSAEFDERNLKLGKLKLSDLQAVLTSDAAAFLEYSVIKMSMPDDDEEEYPAGEEPGDDERAVTLEDQGYVKGFLVINLMEYILAQRGTPILQAYLRALRIPRAPKYAREVAAMVAKARGKASGTSKSKSKSKTKPKIKTKSKAKAKTK